MKLLDELKQLVVKNSNHRDFTEMEFIEIGMGSMAVNDILRIQNEIKFDPSRHEFT